MNIFMKFSDPNDHGGTGGSFNYKKLNLSVDAE